MEAIRFLGSYINGEWSRSTRPDVEWVKLSPSDLKDEVLKVETEVDHADQAVLAAREAFPSWSGLKQEERNTYLLRLKELFINHAEEVATLISRETGKPLWEAKTEANALASKIDITLNSSLTLVQDQIVQNALPGVTGYIRYKPRGVMAVLGPFNFPAHLPNGHIIPALATGNTVVFKPSEWTPAVGQMLARLIERAGFPRGVFNLVQGRGEVGEKLVMSDQVDGILFTGSYEVGFKIKQATLGHFWKVLALEMGGKNASIVWEDADLEKAIYENLISSFSSSGQRCSCTSRIILHRSVADEFIAKFYEAAKKLSIGHWSQPVFMGPLINESAVEKYIRFQGIAKREGNEALMRGKVFEASAPGHYVTPSINLVKKSDPNSVYQKSEIFGPNVAIFTVDDFQEALQIANSTDYGLVMSVFTKNRDRYLEAFKKCNVGLINWNRGTIGASSRLPFGGMGKSGNHQPSAQFAVYYCTIPVACLEDETPFDRSKILPGVQY